MVQFPQFECDEIGWNCRSHRAFGTRVSGTFVKLETFEWNSVVVDTCAVDVRKIDACHEIEYRWTKVTFEIALCWGS